MKEYELYLRAYAAARMGFTLPDAADVREALAIAHGVRDAKDCGFQSAACLAESLKRHLDL